MKMSEQNQKNDGQASEKDVELDIMATYDEIINDLSKAVINAQRIRGKLEFVRGFVKNPDRECENVTIAHILGGIEELGNTLAFAVRQKEYYKEHKNKA